MTQVVDIAEKFSRFSEAWTPKLVGEVNGVQVRLARLASAFDWHAHPDADEMFLVIEGAMDMHYRDRTERLAAGQAIIVPKGVEHRPQSVQGECKIMLIERAGVVNTGDRTDSAFTVERPEEI